MPSRAESSYSSASRCQPSGGSAYCSFDQDRLLSLYWAVVRCGGGVFLFVDGSNCRSSPTVGDGACCKGTTEQRRQGTGHRTRRPPCAQYQALLFSKAHQLSAMVIYCNANAVPVRQAAVLQLWVANTAASGIKVGSNIQQHVACGSYIQQHA